MARVATTPVSVPNSRRESEGAIAASPGQTPLTSITKQMAQQGAGSPQDLIFSMMLDHEQVGRRRQSLASRAKSPTAAARQPAQGSPSLSEATSPPGAGPAVPLTERPRSDSSTLKCDHWKPIDKAGKCANRGCRRRFTWKDRARNCCMCGEVFCRPCVKFRRKLSSNAEPDPLGTFHNVCHACFDLYPRFGAQRDLGVFFKHDRSIHQKACRQREQVEMQIPLSQRERSRSKRVAVREEVARLTEGYQTHGGLVKNLLSVSVPEWQKSPHWLLASESTHCLACKKQFRLMNRKIHCRVCGQVFCTDCTKEEILLYIDNGEPPCARWAINGRSGGPTVKPQSFELLPICSHCSTELESILVDEITCEPDPEVVGFLDRLVPLQKELLELQNKVEAWLPTYQMIVDSMDIEQDSPQAVEGRHPLRDLAKAQCDLSDVFSQLAMRSQSLRGLQSRAKTELQQKLLKHVMLATYQYYSENMYLFRNSRNRLAELMPMESIVEIQSFLNQQSMERVHIILQQTMYEALKWQKRFKFDDSFLELCIEPVKAMDAEFKSFMERNGESWDEHLRLLKEFIKSEMSSNQRFKISNSALRHQQNPSLYVHHRVASECLSMVERCLRELSAKTSDRAFLQTKSSLEQVSKELKMLVSTLKGRLSSRQG